MVVKFVEPGVPNDIAGTSQEVEATEVVMFVEPGVFPGVLLQGFYFSMRGLSSKGLLNRGFLA